MVWLCLCDSLQSLDHWLQVLHSELQTAGWTGQIKVFNNDHTPYDDPRRVVSATVAGTVRRFDELVNASSSDSESGWGCGAATIDDAAERAVAAVLSGDGDIYVRHETTKYLVPQADAPDAFRAALRSARWGALIRVGPGGDWTSAVFSALGHMHFERYDPAGGWRAEFEFVRNQLIKHAEVSEYGFVKRLTIPSILWLDLIDRRPGARSVRGSYPHFVRHLEGSRVPDAFASQLLSDEHVASAHDLGSWRQTELGNGMTLVETEDLLAWHDRETPEESTIAKARADFGRMILTQEDVDAQRLGREPG
jgi:hypothetical protein